MALIWISTATSKPSNAQATKTKKPRNPTTVKMAAAALTGTALLLGGVALAATPAATPAKPAARPAAKDDAATMTDSSAALQKAKDGDKKAAGTAGKSSGGSAGKSSAAR